MDSVRFLDSEKLDSRFCFCESLDCESKLLKLDSKLSLDSESALHSALGLPSWCGLRGVTTASKKLVVCKCGLVAIATNAVVLVEFLAGAGVGVPRE